MAVKLIKGIAWVGIWASIWMAAIAIMSNIVPTVAGWFLETMVLAGIMLIAAVVATKITAFIAGFVKILETTMEAAIAEHSKKN